MVLPGGPETGRSEEMIANSIEEITRLSLLYDCYGGLLSEKQRVVTELYHEENLSLAEIAAEEGISRQAVHDALKKAEKALNDYEEKLGLVKKLTDTRQAVRDIEFSIDELKNRVESGADTDEIVEELDRVKSIINGLED